MKLTTNHVGADVLIRPYFYPRIENRHAREVLKKRSRITLLTAISDFSSPGRAQTSPLTIRLAGDEWFLDLLTKTGLISDFEQKNGVHVEVLHKNDRTIMGDLDRGASRGDNLDVIVVRHRLLGELVRKKQVKPIDPFLSDSAVHDPAFIPTQQLFPNWWRELSTYDGRTYGYAYIGLTTFLCYRKDLLNDATNQRAYSDSLSS